MSSESFFIVTPVYNAEKTIERTISSIVLQSYSGKVYYHIQDGKSTDNTLDVINDVLSRISIPKNVTITVSSEADSGMYDAIQKGFMKLSKIYKSDDWLTWINADDYLELSALDDVNSCAKTETANSVKWLSGRASILNLDGTFNRSNYDLHNSYILSKGIAEGKSWSFLQQEGTFFRAECYEFAIKEKVFDEYRFAGDWNLWRVMAQKYELYLISKPLGNFCKTFGQISQLHRSEYESEIDKTVAPSDRAEFINIAHKPEDFNAYIFDIIDGKVTSRVHSLIGHFQYRKKVAIEREKEKSKLQGESRLLANKIETRNNHIYLDHDWQYPAKTEQNAFHKLLKLEVKGDVCLVSFPWATYIDLKNNNKSKAYIFEDSLERIKAFTRGFKTVVTVCQHVLFEKYLDIFQRLNITDVFWSHDIKGHSFVAKQKGIQTHPLPLFAVNVANSNSLTKRDVLFNFIGAKADQYYLTDTRNIIFRLLDKTPGAIVASRDSWHFHELVYSKQINELVEVNSSETDRKADEFKNVLARSIFTLCPSGSGPNSIRLWESIGSGSIPVILADTYLPPGNIELWREAVVFCDESEVAIQKLPDILQEIANDENRLAAMRHAMKQLWLLYGPDTFINDVEVFIRENSLKVPAIKSVNPKVDFSFIESLAAKNLESIPNNLLVNIFLVRLLVSPGDFKGFYHSTLIKNDNLLGMLNRAINVDENGLLIKRLNTIGITI